MQVQGHLLGDEKQDLESATVRCYTSDTIFVAGVTVPSLPEAAPPVYPTGYLPNVRKILLSDIRSISSPCRFPKVHIPIL